MPRFDSYEDGEIEEITQEICCSDPTGPYFVVGGRFIRPDEIVSFQGPEESPSFTLKDGSTVQHNRFNEQENGDLLFRALKVIRRPIGKSQTVKPSFNRILVGENSYGVFDSSFSNIFAVSNPNLTHYHSLDVVNKIATGIAVTNSGNARGIVVEEYEAGNTNEYGPTIGGNDVGPQAGTAVEPNQRRVWIHGHDSGDNSNIQRIDYDGQNGTTVFGGFNVDGNPEDETIGIDPEKGVGFIADAGSIFKFNLDGSGSPTNLGSIPAGELDVDPENERIILYGVGSGTVYIYDYNGNQIDSFSISADIDSISWINGEDRIFIADESNDKIVESDLSGNERDLFNVGIGSRVGIDVGLDLSSI